MNILKVISLFMFVLITGCHKNHEDAKTSPPLMPLTTTSVRTFSVSVDSGTTKSVDILPFNPGTDEVAVWRANGWSSVVVPTCPSGPLCYSVSGAVLTLNDSGTIGYSCTVEVTQYH